VTPHELVWLPRDGKVPDRERITTECKTVMLILVWDPTGFTEVVAIESRCTFNAGYYLSEVLTSLSEWECECEPSRRVIAAHGAERKGNSSSPSLFTGSGSF
jgi:hypothetical protein